MSDTPNCIGFIMDGNRRWAKKHNLPKIEGHKKGGEVFEEVVKYLVEQKISHGIFYAFSTENWNREETEVTDLLRVFSEGIAKISKLIHDEETKLNVRVRFVGNLEKFDGELLGQLKSIEKETKDFTETTIWIALSYGSRLEITEAVNKAIEKGQPVTETDFSRLLWTDGMPDPDLIVRTGGQKRLSNFLLWQAAYSELIFLDEYWPDFNHETLARVLEDFQSTKRNFGK